MNNLNGNKPNENKPGNFSVLPKPINKLIFNMLDEKSKTRLKSHQKVRLRFLVDLINYLLTLSILQCLN